MRLFVIGSGSFIGRHIGRAAEAVQMNVRLLPRDADFADQLLPSDVVLNCTLHPDYRTGTYSAGIDCDLAVARITASRGAHFVMLSTRRVYSDASSWNAHEAASVTGGDSPYGRNKVVTEEAVRALGPRNSIFRLSNIFGMEYEAESSRRTFFAQLLRTLKQENVIRFDMHEKTRRDFLPVESCAQGLVSAVREGLAGTYNLGSGFGVECGSVAGWVMDGFGQGRLIAGSEVKDEFCLNMDAWNSRLYPLMDETKLKNYCTELGQKLQCVEF